MERHEIRNHVIQFLKSFVIIMSWGIWSVLVLSTLAYLVVPLLQKEKPSVTYEWFPILTGTLFIVTAIEA